MISIVITPIEYVLALISGIAVGFSLGLIGGGGSILAVPLLLYFVGLSTVPPQYASNPTLAHEYIDYVDHVALGTTALAVGLNAYINSYMHFKKGNVRIKEGILFSIPGVVGALIGAYISHITPGQSLLFFFGILMIAVAILMLRPQMERQTASKGINNITTISNSSSMNLTKRFNLSDVSVKKIIPAGLIVGFASGYFGIGGGFLIVPGLLFSTGLCMIKAVGTSLISVGTFGIVSAGEYAVYGYVLPLVSITYLIGGIAGGYAGSSIASRMPRGMLRKIFAVIIIAVAIYIMVENVKGLFLLIH
ncbi:TSUP family transporter [Acidianus sulfidivorans JP7]|uniref:Probable membrane transporter protein n=1 Tax=Acidianus sulfidivorans JP7 TaxID=619593 RepID=A0A2U9IM78_9CREN|nr:sulfite exporter TauE/SafE family protein [Acidianus sulfidivorans]AWR97024.1 TSUP family transporter [Acidianus sulfidivorans JP7]